jgi:hypothetical protein
MTQNMEQQPLVLVLGGTGKVGRRIAARLTARGVPVRIGARTAGPAFDWNDPATWPKVLNGVQTVFISYAPDIAVPGAPEAVAEFTAQAAAQGVARVVLLSGRGEPVAEAAERLVQDGPLPWTIVRCSWFAQNFSENFLLDPVLGGEVALPADGVTEPCSPRPDSPRTRSLSSRTCSPPSWTAATPHSAMAWNERSAARHATSPTTPAKPPRPASGTPDDDQAPGAHRGQPGRRQGTAPRPSRRIRVATGRPDPARGPQPAAAAKRRDFRRPVRYTQLRSSISAARRAATGQACHGRGSADLSNTHFDVP